MKHTVLAALVVGVTAAPALADGHASGDADAGEKAFNKCKGCHSIIDADGNAILKGGKAGPNLFGLPGRTAGTLDGFKYRKSIVSAGEGGLVWDEAAFVAYVQDPTAYLKEVTGDSKARSGMSFKLRDEDAAVNIWAFVASVSP